MPSLNEQVYELAKPESQVQRTDQVFLIRFTGEVFPEYEYVPRKLMVFGTCKQIGSLRVRSTRLRRTVEV